MKKGPREAARSAAAEPGSVFFAEYVATPELDEARAALAGERPDLGGFWGAGLAFFLAALGRREGPDHLGPVLVVTATEEEAEEIAGELGAFSTTPVLVFPAWDSLFTPGAAPDGETYRQRLLAMEALARGRKEPLFVVSPVQAIVQPVPDPRAIAEARVRWQAGEERGPRSSAELLTRAGFRHVSLVQARGEFSSRGDIFDFFPYDREHPLRIEFFGDVIESIREFDAGTQRSLGGTLPAAEFILLPDADTFRDAFRGQETLITDLIGPPGRIFLKEPDLVHERAEKILRNRLGEDAERAFDLFRERLARGPAAGAHALPAGESRVGPSFTSVERFRGGDLERVFAGLKERLESGYRFEIWCENDAEAKRFREIVADHGLAGEERLRVRIGAVRRGFEIGALRAAVLTARELFNRHVIRRVRRKGREGRPIDSFLELEQGDVVVHAAHGIGRYLGMESFEKSGALQEFLAIEFRDRVKVYVPVSKIDLVQKYIGGGGREVILDKVGGTSWSRRKQAVETALFDLASELIDIQALRKERPGFAFGPDTEWQREFEAAFPFDETPDQIEVNEAIKEDMQSPRPMDRLLCGDVGYGKTELAMRAAFKAVEAGKQVAVLVPTTVLAQQHYRTFSERMASFPIRVGMLSRFLTPAEQREALRFAEEGKLDILIGTHRLVSDDVRFRDLGLVIIDEEQRFGVTHKEKLKRMRSTVDLLTMTATPIPRTLHMALLGIRDISSLTTAPEGRNPVHTEVTRFSPGWVREVILRELDRDGQAYFVHNRIHDIERVKHDLEQAVPEARIEYAHGQMDESELEEKMLRFFEHDFDVLIATTIIENGLDIPNVNTIFIDEADRHGLADLHQLRGRVGRYKHQAYCYLLLPERRHVPPDAERRIQALVEYSDLGSGFQIALKDLEIRGAGNILGAEQSGHIAQVGYDMYARLLAKAVRRLRNEPASEPVEVEIDLEIEAFIPEDYLAGEAAKIEVYRRISTAASEPALADIGRELDDRFGPYPREVERLLDVQRLRLRAAAAGVEHVGREDDNLIVKGEGGLKKLLAGCPARVAILDPRTAAVSLRDPRGRHAPPVDDERAFRVALEWLGTGSFPEPGARVGAAASRAR